MITIAALYHFARVADPAALRPALGDVCAQNSVRGSLLIAREGINGTIAGAGEGIAAVLAFIRAQDGFAGL
jgi:UPF0176 protein